MALELVTKILQVPDPLQDVSLEAELVCNRSTAVIIGLLSLSEEQPAAAPPTESKTSKRPGNFEGKKLVMNP